MSGDGKGGPPERRSRRWDPSSSGSEREGDRLPWDPLTPAEIEKTERTIADWPPGPGQEWLKEILEEAKAEAEAAAKKD